MKSLYRKVVEEKSGLTVGFRASPLPSRKLSRVSESALCTLYRALLVNCGLVSSQIFVQISDKNETFPISPLFFYGYRPIVLISFLATWAQVTHIGHCL